MLGFSPQPDGVCSYASLQADWVSGADLEENLAAQEALSKMGLREMYLVQRHLAFRSTTHMIYVWKLKFFQIILGCSPGNKLDSLGLLHYKFLRQFQFLLMIASLTCHVPQNTRTKHSPYLQ